MPLGVRAPIPFPCYATANVVLIKSYNDTYSLSNNDGTITLQNLDISHNSVIIWDEQVKIESSVYLISSMCRWTNGVIIIVKSENFYLYTFL